MFKSNSLPNGAAILYSLVVGAEGVSIFSGAHQAPRRARITPGEAARDVTFEEVR